MAQAAAAQATAEVEAVQQRLERAATDTTAARAQVIAGKEKRSDLFMLLPHTFTSVSSALLSVRGIIKGKSCTGTQSRWRLFQ